MTIVNLSNYYNIKSYPPKNRNSIVTSPYSPLSNSVSVYLPPKFLIQKRNSKKNNSIQQHKIYDAVQYIKRPNKTFVFDLDETIGCFTELYTLWRYIFRSTIIKNNNVCIYLPSLNETIKQDLFNELLDLYPEFFRYNILVLFSNLYSYMLGGLCSRIYIYTNNQCEYPHWIKYILRYLDVKINGGKDTLFERPICAFKIKDKIVERLRTSNEKSHYDFIRCSLLARNTEICFLDDKYYSKMVHHKVYYIQPPPYFHSLKHNTIFMRFTQSSLMNKLIQHQLFFENDPLISPFYYDEVDTSLLLSEEEHKQIYMKMNFYVREFISISLKNPYTKKSKKKLGRFTRKKSH